MSPRRGAYRGGRNNSRTPHHHKNWTVRPVVDRQTQEETSSSPESCSNLHQQRRQDQGELSWLPKNPNNDGSKSEFQLGVKEASGGGSGSKSELDYGSKRAPTGGKGSEIAEGENSTSTSNLNSHTDGEVGEDLVVRRLEELRLKVKEPQLSDEVLSINEQLQEDEVLAINCSNFLQIRCILFN